MFVPLEVRGIGKTYINSDRVSTICEVTIPMQVGARTVTRISLAGDPYELDVDLPVQDVVKLFNNGVYAD